MRAAKVLQHMIHQRLDIFRSIAKRRQVNLKTVDAIKQVRAEGSITHDRIKVAVRGRDDADVDFNFAHTTYAEESTRLDRPQQFRL